MRPKRLLGVATACALALAGCGTTHHAAPLSPHAVAITTPAATQTAMGSLHPKGWGTPIGATLTPRLGAPVATREMYDAVVIARIPAGSTAVAGYTAGLYPTYPVLVRAFPHAVVKSIAISWGYRAQCLDVEPFDAIPSEVVAWIRADRAAGFARPCVYSSIWEFVHQVQPLIAAAHIARGSIFEWDADYTNVRHLDPGFDATQWTDHAHGLSLDESTATLAFLGIKPKPRPKPEPVCFHRRERARVCASAKAKIASDQRAAKASRDALAATLQAIARAERDRAIFAHRVRFFQAAEAALAKAN